MEDNNVTSLLDTLILKDGSKLHGIVDYVTTKHVYFFDFTIESHPDYIFMALLWKLDFSHQRFSVFSIRFPQRALPQVRLISKNDIIFTNKDLSPTKKPKQRKSTLKL